MKRVTKINVSTEDAAVRGVILTLDNGESVLLSFADAGIIKQHFLLDELRCGIHNVVADEINSENIDFARGDVTLEDFEQEIFEELEDDITCGDYTALCNDGDWIRERVTDLAVCYGLDND